MANEDKLITRQMAGQLQGASKMRIQTVLNALREYNTRQIRAVVAGVTDLKRHVLILSASELAAAASDAAEPPGRPNQRPL